MTGKMPGVEGVPLKIPSELTAKPPIGAVGGVQTSGASPPLAVNAKLYGEPTVAVGGGVLLMDGGGGSPTVIE
jgi:hypothetical protein